jgi:mannosyltransferase
VARRLPAGTALAPVVPAGIAAVLCFAGIGSKSLWGDEAYSVALARSSWGGLWHVIVQREANMSLYYVALKVWTAFGTSEAWVRSLSALFAVVSVVVVYVLGARLFDERTGLVAALLLAVNAFFVHYAQETRGYSLVLLLSALSTYLFVRCLDEPDGKARIAYAVVGAAAVYAHFFALFVIVAHAVIVRRSGWRRLAPAFAGIAVLVAPLILFVAVRNSGQIDWIPRPTPHDFVDSVQSLAGESRGLLLVYAIVVAAGLVTAWRLSPRDLRPWLLLVAWLAVPVLGSFVLSYAKPIFISRYLIVSLPALVLLAAAGIVRLRLRVLGAIALAALLVLSARTLRYWYADYAKEDWRAATRLVLTRSHPGDGAVFYRPSRRVPFEYYLSRSKSGQPPLSIFPPVPYGHYDLLHDRSRVPSPTGLRTAAESRGRVWLIRGNYEPTSADGQASTQIERALSRVGRRRLRRAFTGEGAGIVVSLYERP